MNIETLKDKLLAKMDENIGQLETLERYGNVLHQLIHGSTNEAMARHTIEMGKMPDSFPEEFDN